MATIIERDVIVVGAGPAGAICASYLAKAGMDVLLLDKEISPIEKPCGDIMCEGMVRHINSLELLEDVDSKSTCIRRINLIGCGGNEAIVPFECYTMPRHRLDKILIDGALSWGVEVRQGCRVIDVIREMGYIRGVVVKEKGTERELRCRLLIGADGTNSIVGKLTGNLSEKPSGIWMGLSGYFADVALERKLAREQYDGGGIIGFDDDSSLGYYWIMPSGSRGVVDGLCNVGMMVKGRDNYSSKELLDKMNDWLSSCDKAAAAMKNAVQQGGWKVGRLADSTQARRPAIDGVIMIGDAAADVEMRMSEKLTPLDLFNDGLSAAANTAKKAADAAIAAFLDNDFSGEYLTEKMEEGKACGSEADDMRKVRTLFMESLTDPELIDILISDYL